MTDIVIPLSTESKFNNLLLRIALRSILRYASNLGNIHIITAANIPWIDNVNIIYQLDTLKHLKDANLINKILTAANSEAVNLHFIFWSDDQVLTAPLDLDKAPIVANDRTLLDLALPKTKWQGRLKHTMLYVLKLTGINMVCNFDSHVPQPYTKTLAKEIFNKVPYTEQPGFCINTIYYGMQCKKYDVQQHNVKYTFLGGNNTIYRKMLLYAGYDDASFQKGIMHFFMGMFFNKSKYEKD